MRKDLIKIIPVLVLLITISSVNQWSDLPIGNTYIWWFIYALCLFLFVKAKKYFYDFSNKRNLIYLYLYLAWNVICIVRGMLVAENYWEWKNLVSTTMILLFPLSIYISTNKAMVQKILNIWIKYALPAFLFFLYFLHTEAFGPYLAPIAFLFLFFPALNNKWKWIVVLISCFVVVIDLGARSTVIKFIIPVIFSSIYYVRAYISTRVLELARLFLIFVPVILLLLALFGTFNIFKMDEYIQGEQKISKTINGKLEEESLTADTRTFLYVEVLESAIKHNYVLWGRTPARGNDSVYFGRHLADELKTGKMERFSNEASILNVFTWTGIIGVIFYFLVLFKASYLAVNKSNNIYIKILGLYVAFRWTYAWVEDFHRFDLSNLLLWITIGMCFSEAFRAMNNLEIKLWVRGIFEKRYVRLAWRLNQMKQQNKAKSTQG